MRSEKVVERAYDKLMAVHDFKNKKEEWENIVMTDVLGWVLHYWCFDEKCKECNKKNEK